jgi:hypothetical protein
MAISVARDLTVYLYINAEPLSFAAAVFGWQKNTAACQHLHQFHQITQISS